MNPYEKTIDIAANSFSDYSKIGPLKGADGQDSTVTENGALTNTSSLSKIVDWFFHGAALRKAEEKRILDLFTDAFKENQEVEVIDASKKIKVGIRCFERSSQRVFVWL